MEGLVGLSSPMIPSLEFAFCQGRQFHHAATTGRNVPGPKIAQRCNLWQKAQVSHPILKGLNYTIFIYCISFNSMDWKALFSGLESLQPFESWIAARQCQEVLVLALPPLCILWNVCVSLVSGYVQSQRICSLQGGAAVMLRLESRFHEAFNLLSELSILTWCMNLGAYRL